MKITIYELLGLIKEGKAPKNIKCYSNNFTFIDGDYICTNGKYETDGLSIFKWIYGQNLNDEVEIIEEKKIEKKIEKIIISMDDYSMPYVTNNKYQKLSYSDVDLLFASKINEIIDVINDMRDKEC